LRNRNKLRQIFQKEKEEATTPQSNIFCCSSCQKETKPGKLKPKKTRKAKAVLVAQSSGDDDSALAGESKNEEKFPCCGFCGLKFSDKSRVKSIMD
jgi:hypothetical protein